MSIAQFQSFYAGSSGIVDVPKVIVGNQKKGFEVRFTSCDFRSKSIVLKVMAYYVINRKLHLYFRSAINRGVL